MNNNNKMFYEAVDTIIDCIDDNIDFCNIVEKYCKQNNIRFYDFMNVLDNVWWDMQSVVKE